MSNFKKGDELFDFLKVISEKNESKTVEIRTLYKLGIIQIKDGKVVFAKSSSGEFGREAFLEIINWKKSKFQILELSYSLKENILVENRFSQLVENYKVVDDTLVKKDIDNHECELLAECPIYNKFKGKGIKNFWIRVYCKGRKHVECERKLIHLSGESVPESLLPNGKNLINIEDSII